MHVSLLGVEVSSATTAAAAAAAAVTVFVSVAVTARSRDCMSPNKKRFVAIKVNTQTTHNIS
jgi:hypothetical protein